MTEKIVLIALCLLCCSCAPSPEELHREAVVVDLHCDTLMRVLEGYRLGERNIEGHVDIPRLQQGGVDLMAIGRGDDFAGSSVHPRYHLPDAESVICLGVMKVQEPQGAPLRRAAERRLHDAALDMAHMLDLAIYLRRHSGPGAVILARKPRMVSLAADRPAVGGPFNPDPAGFVADLEKRNISYIVVDEAFKEAGQYFVPAIKTYPDRFRPVYRVPGTRSAVYQFLPK